MRNQTNRQRSHDVIVQHRNRTPFLTAHWRWLVMVNYEVDPDVLRPHIPKGTELDLFQNDCLVSVVGFLFDQTKLFGGIPIPLHDTFEEVNLRFYVKRRIHDRTRRGVVFIKELVPSRSVTCIARALFHENYHRTPMRHIIHWNEPTSPQEGGDFRYQWQTSGRWSELHAKTSGHLDQPVPGSLAEFITEHYWGYSRRHGGRSLEYAVEHPSWRVWPVESPSLETDVGALYGQEFLQPLSGMPHSGLVAEGSPVAVYLGTSFDVLDR